MKRCVLACDYDGTLAHDGELDDATVAALDRFRASGGRLLMVTGRELPDLQSVCKVLDKFEWIVTENGALLYRPSDNFSKLLCSPASAELAQKLGEAQVQPLSVGRTIIATREPYETLVIKLIKELGLELQVIAATVIGGTSILGGRGTVIGSLIGALLIEAVHNALITLGTAALLEGLIVGILILIAVGVDALQNRKAVKA